MVSLVITFGRDIRIDSVIDDPGGKQYRCSNYENNRGGHIFIKFAKPPACPRCGNLDIDTYEG